MKQHDVSRCVIVSGGDDYLAEQAVRDLQDKALRVDPQAEVIHLDALTASEYDFDEAVSPSLLSLRNIVQVCNLQAADEKLIDAMSAFCSDNRDGDASSFVIARHDGGLKGRKFITRLVGQGASEEKIPELKYPNDKLGFVMDQFARNHRRVDPQAAQQLISVLGDRTAELAAMCSQLCFDFEDDPIGINRVDQYLDADPQVTGFAVADQALAGHGAQSIESMRAAVKQLISPIAMIGALEMKLRSLAKASAVQSGVISTAEAKMSPWMLNNAKRQLSGWTSQGLSNCLQALAAADESNKSNAGDPVYALERCLMLISHKGRNI
ncbi:DNA polymerase III subunit delta [Bifidobacterium bombi]|nr:DNA polymerase III subunit delta [Bifidobacterium bombi]